VISAFDIARMMALGADWCNAARGFMFALGCIQAQTCHTGTCPTGVTTQDPLRQRRWWCPTRWSASTASTSNTLHALQELVQAAGLQHPNARSPPRTSCAAPSTATCGCWPTSCRWWRRAPCWRPEGRAAGRTTSACTGRWPTSRPHNV
jgi:hypothetical protein